MATSSIPARAKTSGNMPINGFTIVELLIVIVVIAIIAAISIVAYSGIQERVRDSARRTSMRSIEQAIDMYFIDHGGYPDCYGGTYRPGTASGDGCPVSSLADVLVPTYLNEIPTDPINTDFDIFQYAPGRRKLSASTYANDHSNNYIVGMHLETVDGSLNIGWADPPYYNYLGGSSN